MFLKFSQLSFKRGFLQAFTFQLNIFVCIDISSKTDSVDRRPVAEHFLHP